MDEELSANMASPSGSVVLVRYSKVANIHSARKEELSVVWEGTQTLERAFGRSERCNAREFRDKVEGALAARVRSWG